MTDFYDEDLIKQVKQFDDVLDKNWYKTLDELPENKAVSEMKWCIHYLQYAVKVLYVIIESEMKQTNKINKIISKLPNEEKFQELKKVIEDRDGDIEQTLKPLSGYVKELEESKNRKVDYIG